MAEFLSVPGVDGEVAYIKRQPDLAIRVIDGRSAAHHFEAEIGEESTHEFVTEHVMPTLSEEKPRLHAHLDSSIAVLSVRASTAPQPKYHNVVTTEGPVSKPSHSPPRKKAMKKSKKAAPAPAAPRKKAKKKSKEVALPQLEQDLMFASKSVDYDNLYDDPVEPTPSFGKKLWSMLPKFPKFNFKRFKREGKDELDDLVEVSKKSEMPPPPPGAGSGLSPESKVALKKKAKMKGKGMKHVKTPVQKGGHIVFQKKVKHFYGEYNHDYIFVSHAWSAPVKHLMGFLAGTQLHTWCDVFAVAQLPGEEQNKDLKNITEAVYGAAEMRVLVDPEGTCFTRIWCLFEMVTRVRSGKGQINFITPALYFELGETNFQDLSIENKRIYWRKSAKVLDGVLKRGIDCKRAKATVEADRERILNWIEQDVGTKNFNKTISTLIRDEITKLRMAAGPSVPVQTKLTDKQKEAQKAKKKKYVPTIDNLPTKTMSP